MWKIAWLLSALPLLLAPLVRADQTPLPQAWDYAGAMKAVAAKSRDSRPGVVLHVGDSITYANPYGAWALNGKGHTPDDAATLKWMHAGSRDDTDGWHLAAADHPAGKQGMPPLKDLFEKYKPQAVVFMLGTNDASAGRTVDAYRRDVEAALDLMLSRGIVPIVSTIPPHVHHEALARSYNEALREIARAKKLPLIDYEKEILAR